MTEIPKNSFDTADPFARQLMTRYLARRHAGLPVLRQALADEDFEAVRLAGHKMFGSGAAYGFDEITRLGERLEKAAHAEQVEAIQGLIDELEKFISRQHVGSDD